MTEDIDDEELDRMLEQAVSQQSKMNRSMMSGKSRRSKAKRPLTFAEMREKERIAEASKIAPGAYGKDIIEFGKDLNNITIFGKYKDKYESKPPVGAYNPDLADKWTKPKTRSARIDPGQSYNKKEDPTPDPGAYTKLSDLPFGKDVASKNMTLGGKYKPETNDNPAPGAYNPDLAD